MRRVLGLLALLCGCGAADEVEQAGQAVEPADGAAADAEAAGDAGAVAPDAAPPDADAAGDPPGDCLTLVRVGDLEVFAYEASRPDADAEQAGADGARACSRPGVLPWTTVTVPEARAACAASGFRLCTDADWQSACTGGRAWAFPYGATHVPGTCNDHVSGASALRPTGDYPDCRTPEGAFDLSGNVWELTEEGSRRGASHRVNAVMFHVDSARCDITYTTIEGYADEDVGFRCCR